MKRIIIEVEDNAETRFTPAYLAAWMSKTFNHPGQAIVEVEVEKDTITVQYEKVYSDIEFDGALYEMLKNTAKKRGITVEQLLEQGAKNVR